MKRGDIVLVTIVAFDGKHKIADHWENITYIIIQQPNIDMSVFMVKRGDGEGRCKTLHRNLHLPTVSKPPSSCPVVNFDFTAWL